MEKIFLTIFLIFGLFLTFSHSFEESVNSIEKLENEEFFREGLHDIGEFFKKIEYKFDAWEDRIQKKIPKYDLTGIITNYTRSLNRVTTAPWIEKSGSGFIRDFKICMRIPILNVTCVQFFVNSTSLNAGVRVTADGSVLIEYSVATVTKVCVDEIRILWLATNFPAVVPFKPILSQVKTALGFIPGRLFSFCVFPNFLLTKDRFSGDVELDLKVLCWMGKCVYQNAQKVAQYGIPLTANGGSFSFKPLGTLTTKRKKRAIRSMEQISQIQKLVGKKNLRKMRKIESMKEVTVFAIEASA